MKNSTNLFRTFRIEEIRSFRYSLIIVLLLNFISVLSSCAKTDNRVKEAFELRINGKTDQAKELLVTILKEDSTNAAANFELARTLNYMNLMGSDEADKALKSAIKYDPQNIIYAYYNAKNCFLKAYIAMHQESDNVKTKVNDVCDEFVKVLEMKSDYPEAMMYLVEIYGMLPEEMGGDKVKAEEYTQKLERMDKFYGAKARLVMMPEGTDMVDHWKKYINKNGEDCKALKELGVAYLFSDNFDEAEIAFYKAIAIDKSQNIRLLDLARFHMMKVMQNKDAAATEIPKSKEFIEKYMKSTPEPIPPLKAFSIGMLVNFEMFSGNKAEAEKLMAEAKALDPYFSRAFGIPSLAIFEQPDKLDHHFQSFFSPY